MNGINSEKMPVVVGEKSSDGGRNVARDSARPRKGEN